MTVFSRSSDVTTTVSLATTIAEGKRLLKGRVKYEVASTINVIKGMRAS